MDNSLEIDIPSNAANIQLPDPTLLDYYNNLENRVVWIEDEIDDSLMYVVKYILKWNKEDRGKTYEERKPIKIFINTVGGDVPTMWAIVNAIKLSKTPVYTIVCSNAMSAGGYILVAGHKRFAMPGSTILIHSGFVGYSGSVEQVESAKKYYDSLEKKINAYLLERTNIPKKELRAKSATDWYLTDEDALRYGIVDKIIEDIEEVC